ncbi:MAG: LCP family protein [Candidatus Moranbacteria bacterium]|nr:LCP family protein [Candidatus Moranbacteria bacterium]
MDGIKKKLTLEPKKAALPLTTKVESFYFPKKEDLYIPKEETFDKHLKKEGLQRKRSIRKFIWITLLVILTALLSFLFFFLSKIYSTTKKMNVSTEQTTLSQDLSSMLSPIIPSATTSTLRGEKEGRINILLLGAAGEHKPGGNLTDTIMIMSIDTKNRKVALLSLPRDFYVPIGDTTSFTKINSLYKIGIAQEKGIDLTKQAVEKVTGVTINYYMTVDFDAFAKIIDHINGVNILVERDIYDPTYPGPNYSYELFALKKGAYLLNGDTTLKYVRERHDDPEGDFGRAKRQQQVIQAVKSRIFSMQTIFNVVALSNILDTLGDNIKTDMTFNDIEQFIKLSKEVDTQNITNTVVDAWKPDSLLKVSHVMLGNDLAFILVPRVGSYSEIKDLALNIFNQDELKKRQASIINEAASISIVNKSTNTDLANKIKKMLTEKLGMKKVQIIPNPSDEITEKTIINNNSSTEKIFTLDELIKKLPASLASESAASSEQATIEVSDITITLGNDLVDTYKYEEDSIDDFNKAQDKQDSIDFSKVN